MKRLFYKFFIKSWMLLLAFSILFAGTPAAFAAESAVITSVEELTTALLNAKDGDVLLVGDITFQPMPKGLILVPKNVTVRSGKGTNAVFTNATFALNGTRNASAPLTVKFENIDFRGDRSGTPVISTELPGIMQTMCAAICKMNVDVSCTGCSFEGYHYGYGGVFNAIYPAEDYENALKLTLDGCSFRNNASKYGGSLYLCGYGHNISLDARRCTFADNAAATGGAIWAQDADVRLLDCAFTGNGYLNAETDAPNGGALALYNCSAELDGCLIARNVSGGKGAGIFCEISPFKTLILENCTLIGNTSAADEGISVVPAKTNFDTPAAAHVYFSSLFGRQELAEHAETFGCLLAAPDVTPEEPGAANGFCLTLTPEQAREKGLDPEAAEHVLLPKNAYPVPKAAADKITGGKFADSFCPLQVGDNYRKEAALAIEETPGRVKTVTVQYGDTVVLEKPARKGYSFEGWKYPEGTPAESGKVFRGGALPEGKITARWHFVLSENLYVIWVPLLALAVIGAIVFMLLRRKKKAAAAAVLPEDWISRVCEKPEITGQLSKRETEVLQKLLEGKGRKQIADELFVTEATIKKHSASIYAKLDVHNRTELIYKLTKS